MHAIALGKSFEVLGDTLSEVFLDQKKVRLGGDASKNPSKELWIPLVSVSKFRGNLALLLQRGKGVFPQFPLSVILFFEVFPVCVPPNQAPEPTTMAVTPRAIERISK